MLSLLLYIAIFILFSNEVDSRFVTSSRENPQKLNSEHQLEKESINPYFQRIFGKNNGNPTTETLGKIADVCHYDIAGKLLNTKCCFKPFTVDFAEIGWNTWIIQPHRLETGYCVIPGVNEKTYMRETLFQETCKPKFKDFSILYSFDVGEIRKKVLPDIRAVGCMYN